HGYLGNRLIYTYAPGQGPTYQVDGYDNFKAIFSSKNLTESVKNIGRWLSGYDRHQDGAAGWCSSGHGRVNALGGVMGSHGRRAWVSITGSLPALGIDSVMVASAVQVRQRHPRLAALMGGYATYDHLVNSSYPLTAAIMNSAKLEEAAAKGHDFASFAIHISAMTGISAIVVARLTFLAWLGFVPFVALVSYWHERSRVDSLISDEEALNFFSQSWNTNNELSEIYTAFKKYHQPNVENGYTYPYLLEHLDLRAVKQHMLNKVRASIEVDQVEICLSRLSTGASFVSLTSRLVTTLAATAYPALKPLASVLKIAAPVMQTLTIAQAFYRAKKDLSAREEESSATIKVLSVARAVSVAVTSLGILASPWISQRKWILPASIVGSVILPVGFDYLRAQAIRKKMAVEVGPVRS
ncbi:MAG: hypothetical protein JSR80_00625, partial [Verrucomicrobia bacterium]|nr:hypothetical protein [Verrucomicrobiota bacterium]